MKGTGVLECSHRGDEPVDIHILPSQVSSLIAAGEVVERPASVVKELVENSIDAGASQIAIEVSQGGLAFIRVSDNGCGVAAESMALAFHRFGTSKLSRAEDLERIVTLGFRGEALPSIAAVADVEMVSRPADAQAAAMLRLVDGKPVEQGSRAAAVGTTVTVLHLFAKQPARRKFLRAPAAENHHIASLISQYALAYPEVRFSLKLDGRQALTTAGSGSLTDAVAAAHGPDVAAAMISIRWPPAGESAAFLVSGLAAPPHLSRASRGYVSLFVNRRWVQHRRLTYAIEEAYSGLLPVGRHPIAVVNLEVPPDEVDVNVHPTKAEVRLRHENEVFVALQRAVRQAVLEQAPVPTVAVPTGPPPPPEPSAEAAMLPLWKHGVEAGAQAQAVAATAPPRVSLPLLRVLGQVAGTFIVAEGPDGLYLIDQHAAHERVLFEEVCAARQHQKAHVQGLLEPALAELSPRQEEALLAYGDTLAEHGFQLEPFGQRSYRVRGIPALLTGRDAAQALTKLLDSLAEETADPSADRVAATLACHGAVRAGQSLAPEEMRELVRRLEQAEVPHTCPHGRPTTVHLSGSWLAQSFRRRG
jgi:DNA mismatch repair protein MutL